VAKIDRIKEEIGWLKVVFGILVATDISLLAWLAEKFASAPKVQVIVSLVVVVIVTGAIVWVNHLAYGRIQQLEDLSMDWIPVVALLVFLVGLGLVLREIASHSRKQ